MITNTEEVIIDNAGPSGVTTRSGRAALNVAQQSDYDSDQSEHAEAQPQESDKDKLFEAKLTDEKAFKMGISQLTRGKLRVIIRKLRNSCREMHEQYDNEVQARAATLAQEMLRRERGGTGLPVTDDEIPIVYGPRPRPGNGGNSGNGDPNSDPEGDDDDDDDNLPGFGHGRMGMNPGDRGNVGDGDGGEPDEPRFARYISKVNMPHTKGLKLTKLITDDEWISWRFKTKSVMRVLGLWKIVRNKVPKIYTPTDTMLRADKEYAWMLLAKAMPKEHMSLVMDAKMNPHTLFSSLESYYHSELESAKVNAREIWLDTVQGKNEMFAAFYERWRMALMNVEGSGQMITENDKVLQLLKSLNKKYNMDVYLIRKMRSKGTHIGIHDVIETMRETDNWRETRERINKHKLDQARQANLQPPEDSNNKSGNTKARSAHVPTKTKGNNANGKHKKSIKDIKCFNCQKFGHFQSKCPENDKRPSTANQDSDETGRKRKFPTKDLSTGNSPTTKAACVRYATVLQATIDPDQQFTAVIDSGCTRHMSPHRQDFASYTTFDTPRRVTLADHTTIEAEGIGNIVTYNDGTEGGELVWEDAYHVPDLSAPLFSCTQIIRSGYEVVMRASGIELVYIADRRFSCTYGAITEDGNMTVTWEIDRTLHALHGDTGATQA